jgi:hypothetical protein
LFIFQTSSKRFEMRVNSLIILLLVVLLLFCLTLTEAKSKSVDPEGWSVTGNVGGNTRGGGVNWNVGATYSWDDSEQRYRYGDKRDYGIQKGPVYQTRPYFPGRKGAVFPRVMSDSKNKFNPGYIQPVRW